MQFCFLWGTFRETALKFFKSFDISTITIIDFSSKSIPIAKIDT